MSATSGPITAKPQNARGLRLLYALAQADMVFYILPALMVLLVAGTLAQRWIGLFPAYDMFFGTFIIWLGWVPLPGGFTLLGVLGLNLLLKFLLQSQWRWAKAGIHLSHLGVLVLLIGGVMTALTGRASYMVIPEGSATPYIYAYSERSLSIFADEKEIARLPFHKAEKWGAANLPFTLKVLDHCQNCQITKRAESGEEAPQAPYRQLAEFMALKSITPGTEPEADLSGVTMEISGVNPDFDGTYIAFDGMPKAITLEKSNDESSIFYTLIFGKDQEELPFSIALNDFVKDRYDGTDLARAYHSDVIVQDGAQSWPYRIEMNKPLRYRGYTFFQSSFEETPEGDVTILAVVKNQGRLLPYLGTLMIGAGLLLHLFMRLRRERSS